MTTSRSNKELLHELHNLITKGQKQMANSFTRLSADIDRVAAEIQKVANKLRAPHTDNSDQAQIDDLAGRLEAAANTLQDAMADPTIQDSGTSSVSSANNNPDQNDAATAQPLPDPANSTPPAI